MAPQLKKVNSKLECRDYASYRKDYIFNEPELLTIPK